MGSNPIQTKFLRSKRRNKQELQTFLDLATYVGPLIPRLSTLTTPLRELVKQNSSFTTYHDVPDKITESISDEITMKYFDPPKETILQMDTTNVSLLQAKPLTLWSQDTPTLSGKCQPWCMAAKDSIPFCLGDNSLSIQTISLWKEYILST